MIICFSEIFSLIRYAIFCNDSSIICWVCRVLFCSSILIYGGFWVMGFGCLGVIRWNFDGSSLILLVVIVIVSMLSGIWIIDLI